MKIKGKIIGHGGVYMNTYGPGLLQSGNGEFWDTQESSPKPPPERNPLCGELWDTECLRKS